MRQQVGFRLGGYLPLVYPISRNVMIFWCAQRQDGPKQLIEVWLTICQKAASLRASGINLSQIPSWNGLAVDVGLLLRPPPKVALLHHPKDVDLVRILGMKLAESNVIARNMPLSASAALIQGFPDAEGLIKSTETLLAVASKSLLQDSFSVDFLDVLSKRRPVCLITFDKFVVPPGMTSCFSLLLPDAETLTSSMARSLSFQNSKNLNSEKLGPPLGYFRAVSIKTIKIDDFVRSKARSLFFYYFTISILYLITLLVTIITLAWTNNHLIPDALQMALRVVGIAPLFFAVSTLSAFVFLFFNYATSPELSWYSSSFSNNPFRPSIYWVFIVSGGLAILFRRSEVTLDGITFFLLVQLALIQYGILVFSLTFIAALTVTVRRIWSWSRALCLKIKRFRKPISDRKRGAHG